MLDKIAEWVVGACMCVLIVIALGVLYVAIATFPSARTAFGL